MENLENLAVEEVIEEVVEPTKPSVGKILGKGVLIAGAAFGVYKGVKWVKGKIKARKAKKAAEDVEDTEE